MTSNISRQVFYRILQNTGRFLSGRIVNALLSCVYLMLASHALGVSGLGYLMLIMSTVSMLASLTNLDAWVPLQNFGEQFLRKKDFDGFFSLFAYAIRIDCLSSILGVSFGAIGVWFLGNYLHEWPSELQRYAMWSVLFIPFFYTDFSYGTLRLFRQYTFLGFCASFGTAFRVIGALIGCLLGFGIGYFLIINVLGKAVIFTLESWFCFYKLRRHIPHPFKLNYLFQKRPNVEGIWQQMFSLSADGVILSVFHQTNTLLIGKFLGSADVALYQVSRQIVEAVVSPVRTFAHTMVTDFVEMLDAGLWQELKIVIKKIYLILISISLVSAIFILIVGQYIASFLLHAQIVGVRPLMLLLLAVITFELFLMPLDPILLRSTRAVRARMHGRIFMVCGYFSAFPFFLKLGLMGVALDDLCEAVTMFLVCFVSTSKFIRGKY